MSAQNIVIKRAYEDADAGDGQRFLIDATFPRGLKKERLQCKVPRGLAVQLVLCTGALGEQTAELQWNGAGWAWVDSNKVSPPPPLPQEWRRQVAASAPLRKWFGAKGEHFGEYKRRYFAELDANPDAWRPLVEAARHGKVRVLEGRQSMPACLPRRGTALHDAAQTHSHLIHSCLVNDHAARALLPVCR
jgi:uncharacterized protein YeaO (DUF488 family)